MKIFHSGGVSGAERIYLSILALIILGLIALGLLAFLSSTSRQQPATTPTPAVSATHHR